MARGRSGILACIAPNLTDYTFASLISGAENEAREQGYFLLSASAADVETFGALLDELVTGRRAEGLIVINPFADDRHTYLPGSFPTVFAGARPREQAANSVALDDEAVARQATDHLLALGHRRLACITGPLAEDCSQDRCRGFCDSLTGAGLEVRAEMFIEGTWQAQSGYEGLMAFAAAGEMPTAIFAQNDQMAVGVLRAAADLGLRAPEDLSVIGVDDIPLAAFFAPALTTVRQDFQRIGREAAGLLVQIIERSDADRRYLRLPGQLIVRNSTATAPAAGSVHHARRNHVD
jgi:LacI family repressor for deo operon, udp, cdd, tsx, nupC, and nupG